MSKELGLVWGWARAGVCYGSEDDTVGDYWEVERRRLKGCLGLKGVANRLLD